MKRKITIFFSFLLALLFSAICFIACGTEEGDTDGVRATVVSSTQTQVVVFVDEAREDTTVYDVMCYLEGEEKLSFESTSSQYGEMMKSINGKANGLGDNPCWLLYTSDADETLVFNSAEYNEEYEGEILYSCNFGMSTMPVKEG